MCVVAWAIDCVIRLRAAFVRVGEHHADACGGDEDMHRGLSFWRGASGIARCVRRDRSMARLIAMCERGSVCVRACVQVLRETWLVFLLHSLCRQMDVHCKCY